MSEFTKGELKEVVECCNAISLLSKEDGSQVAQVMDEEGDDLTDIQKANAKELVRRWNSQPDLLEACIEAQKVFGFIAENYKSAPHFPNAERLVEAAIAKATHKP